MFQLIEKLRNKPDRTKKQVAFLLALSISGIIFVIWLSVIYPAWSSDQKKEEKVSQIEPSPIESFSANFSAGLSGIKEQIFKIKESTSFFKDPNLKFSSTTMGTSTPNSGN